MALPTGNLGKNIGFDSDTALVIAWVGTVVIIILLFKFGFAISVTEFILLLLISPFLALVLVYFLALAAMTVGFVISVPLLLLYGIYKLLVHTGLIYALGLYLLLPIVFITIGSLTIPALSALFLHFPSVLPNCLALAIEAMIAGLFIACLKKAFNFRSKLGKAFLTELFSFRILKSDQTFLATLGLSLLVSMLVGWVAGATGTVGVTSLLSSDYGTTIEAILHTSLPVTGIMTIGGGAEGGFVEGAFFWVVLVIIIFAIQGMLIGASSGLTFGVLMGALQGTIKGGILEGIINLVAESKPNESTGTRILMGGKKGMIEGAIVGGIVGLVQGIITSKAFFGARG